ncbi:MAG: hypothetical protein JSW62_03975, partial [Thermoplasmatales archaeon]
NIAGARKNKIIANNITNNYLSGIAIPEIRGSFSFPIQTNEVYYNNFIRNGWSKYTGTNAMDWAYNIWYKTEQSTGYGNYWDDYNGVDADGSGIGDTSYNICPRPDDNLDCFPFVDPVDINDVVVTNFDRDFSNYTVTISRDKMTSNMLLLRILERFPLLQRLFDIWRWNT